jgi:hypothetical protein
VWSWLASHAGRCVTLTERLVDKVRSRGAKDGPPRARSKDPIERKS